MSVSPSFAKNDWELAEWALRCLRVPRDQVVRACGATRLPVDTPVTAGLLLSEFAELQEAATCSDLAMPAGATECPWTRRQLAELENDYADEILAKRVTVLTLLERFPAITLPLFLEMAGPIRPRYYSISSSPPADPRRVRITVGLVAGPAWSGAGRYRGMCGGGRKPASGNQRAETIFRHFSIVRLYGPGMRRAGTSA